MKPSSSLQQLASPVLSARDRSISRVLVASSLAILLAACSAPRPAPVENRSAAPAPQAPATRPATAAPATSPSPAAASAATSAARRPAATATQPQQTASARPAQDRPGAQAMPVEVRPIDSGSRPGSAAVAANEAPPPLIRSDASAGARPGPAMADSQRPAPAAAAVNAPPAPQAAGGQGTGASVAPPPSPAPSGAAQSPAQTPAPLASAAPSGAGPTELRFIWPAPGKVLEGFSEPRNMGIAIDGQPGDPILAAADGKVIFSGVGPRGYGNLIIVKHENDVLSVYGHNRALMVREGDQVARGQKIAELGDSDADRPKLRFEIRREGKPVDPSRYLPAR